MLTIPTEKLSEMLTGQLNHIKLQKEFLQQIIEELLQSKETINKVRLIRIKAINPLQILSKPSKLSIFDNH